MTIRMESMPVIALVLFLGLCGPSYGWDGLNIKGQTREGIMKSNGFYVSCADFVDDKGGKYDLDLLVADRGGNFQVLETVVHAINGEKRKYHLEDK